jgi:rSAM/selenodomain-associated transferase 2
LDEQENIGPVLANVRAQQCKGTVQVIVVDGDPARSTVRVIDDGSVVCATAPKGRASQMNAGAALADGEILIFLHADIRLPPRALDEIQSVLSDGRYVAGAFDLHIDSKRWVMRYLAAAARLRSRLNRIPNGDQTLFMKRTYFEAIGRYSDMPLMEDVELMCRIKARGDKVHILRDRVVASPRRWFEEGICYSVVRNWTLSTLYHLGVRPERLVAYYKTHAEIREARQSHLAARAQSRADKSALTSSRSFRA